MRFTECWAALLCALVHADAAALLPGRQSVCYESDGVISYEPTHGNVKVCCPGYHYNPADVSPCPAQCGGGCRYGPCPPGPAADCSCFRPAEVRSPADCSPLPPAPACPRGQRRPSADGACMPACDDGPRTNCDCVAPGMCACWGGYARREAGGECERETGGRAKRQQSGNDDSGDYVLPVTDAGTGEGSGDGNDDGNGGSRTGRQGGWCLNGTCQNGWCTSAGICQCDGGYAKNNENTCVRVESSTHPQTTTLDNLQTDTPDYPQTNRPNDCINEDFFNGTDCVPICSGGCPADNCTEPCTCNDDYYANKNGTCTPTCTAECGNGRCTAPDKCTCNNGYETANNGTCIPNCTLDYNCPGDKNNNTDDNPPGTSEETPTVYQPPTAVGPDFTTGGCGPGYRQGHGSGECVPICERGCENGECVRPNDCACTRGYAKDARGRCAPQCDGGCKLGSCVAPGRCTGCVAGYSLAGNGACQYKGGGGKEVVKPKPGGGKEVVKPKPGGGKEVVKPKPGGGKEDDKQKAGGGEAGTKEEKKSNGMWIVGLFLFFVIAGGTFALVYFMWRRRQERVFEVRKPAGTPDTVRMQDDANGTSTNQAPQTYHTITDEDAEAGGSVDDDEEERSEEEEGGDEGEEEGEEEGCLKEVRVASIVAEHKPRESLQATQDKEMGGGQQKSLLEQAHVISVLEDASQVSCTPQGNRPITQGEAVGGGDTEEPLIEHTTEPPAAEDASPVENKPPGDLADTTDGHLEDSRGVYDDISWPPRPLTRAELLPTANDGDKGGGNRRVSHRITNIASWPPPPQQLASVESTEHTAEKEAVEVGGESTPNHTNTSQQEESSC